MNRRAFAGAMAAAVPSLIGGCAGIRRRDALRWERLAPVPDAVGLAAPVAGDCGGSLLVAGGANFPRGYPWEGGTKVWHDRVWALDSPDGRWREAGRLPRRLAYAVSVTTAGGLVVAGGSDPARHYAEAFRLVRVGDGIRADRLPPLPVPLANAAGALVGGRVVVFGGSREPGEGSAENRCWSLDPANPSAGWREHPRLPGPGRFLAAAAAVGGDFYAIGGVRPVVRNGGKAREYLRDCWRLRAGGGWERLADLPRPMAAAPSPAPVVDGEILLLPGDDGSLAGFEPVADHPGFSRRMLAYDFRRDAWREAGEAPFAMVTTSCVAWRGRLVVPGGEVRPGVRSAEVWAGRMDDMD